MIEKLEIGKTYFAPNWQKDNLVESQTFLVERKDGTVDLINEDGVTAYRYCTSNLFKRQYHETIEDAYHESLFIICQFYNSLQKISALESGLAHRLYIHLERNPEYLLRVPAFLEFEWSNYEKIS